jgi:hypothetical protein
MGPIQTPQMANSVHTGYVQDTTSTQLIVSAPKRLSRINRFGKTPLDTVVVARLAHLETDGMIDEVRLRSVAK